MPAPTIVSSVLQDDGRYAVTLSDGAVFFSGIGETLQIDFLRQILAAGGGGGGGGTVNQGTAGTDPWPVLASIDTTGLATDTGQTAQTADLDSIVASLADVGAAGTLADLDDAVTVALATHAGAGFAAIDAGGFDGELTAELSFDGGTSWSATYSSNPVRDGRWLQAVPSSDSEFTSADFFTIALFPGATHVRVRCSTYTAGGVTVTLTATAVASAYKTTDAKREQAIAPYGAQMLGDDSGVARTIAVTTLGNVLTRITGASVGAFPAGASVDVAALAAALVPASITADLTATDDAVTLSVGTARGVALQTTVNASGDQTYVLEAQLPGSAWFGVAAVPNGAFSGSNYAYAPGDPLSFDTTPLLLLLPAGAATVRARCTGGTTGSLTLTLAVTEAPGPLGIATSGGFGRPAGPILTVQDDNGNPFPPGPLAQQPISVHPNRNSGLSIDSNPTLQGITSNQFFAYTQAPGGFTGTYKFQGLYFGADVYDIPVFDLDAHAWLAPGTVLSGPGRFVLGNDVASTWGDDPNNLDSEVIQVQALMLTHTGGDLVVYFTENPFPQVYGAPGTPGPAVLSVQGTVAQSTPLALELASLATRTSADIHVTGTGLILTVQLANIANAPTITPTINGKTASGAYVPLWAAAAALTGNGTAVYQLGPMAATAVAGGITEGKIALIPGVVQIVLAYTGDGATDVVDTTADLDVTP